MDTSDRARAEEMIEALQMLTKIIAFKEKFESRKEPEPSKSQLNKSEEAQVTAIINDYKEFCKWAFDILDAGQYAQDFIQGQWKKIHPDLLPLSSIKGMSYFQATQAWMNRDKK